MGISRNMVVILVATLENNRKTERFLYKQKGELKCPTKAIKKSSALTVT